MNICMPLLNSRWIYSSLYAYHFISLSELYYYPNAEFYNAGADAKFLKGGGANARLSIVTEQRVSMMSTYK